MTTKDSNKRKQQPLISPKGELGAKPLKQGIANPSPSGRLGGAAYTDIVITYLNDKNIPFCRQGANKPVFVLFEMGTANIYCLFDFPQGVVMNWSLVSWAVPEPQKAAITDLLADINSGLKSGMFYVDEQTGCVAFSRTYIQPKDTIPDRQSIENFCGEVLEAMPLYHDRIWNVAFNGKNNAAVQDGRSEVMVRIN